MSTAHSDGAILGKSQALSQPPWAMPEVRLVCLVWGSNFELIRQQHAAFAPKTPVLQHSLTLLSIREPLTCSPANSKSDLFTFFHKLSSVLSGRFCPLLHNGHSACLLFTRSVYWFILLVYRQFTRSLLAVQFYRLSLLLAIIDEFNEFNIRVWPAFVSIRVRVSIRVIV